MNQAVGETVGPPGLRRVMLPLGRWLKLAQSRCEGKGVRRDHGGSLDWKELG